MIFGLIRPIYRYHVNSHVGARVQFVSGHGWVITVTDGLEIWFRHFYPAGRDPFNRPVKK